MKLIHLTDPHLTKPGECIYGLNPQERFNAAIDDINRNHADADVCVITGDLAHTVEDRAYDVLHECLERLQPPSYFIMGNHDNREKLKQRFPSVGVDKNGFIQSRITTEAGNLFLLDTVQPGTHEGVFCETRREWLREQLSQTEDVDAFLFTHHPPFKIGIASMDEIGMNERDALAMGELLDEFDNVRHLFFGHLHRPLNGTWRGIGFSSIRATNHQVWLDFKECDHIPGSYEPPAYAIALIERDQVVIHTHDFLDDSRKFSLGSWRYDDWVKENAK